MDQEEKNNYIGAVEGRFNVLEEGENRTIGLAIKNIDHKRAFLGTAMTISAATIAGLFILLDGKDFDGYFKLLAMISSFCFAIFIISSSIYLTLILSQESSSLDNSLKFVRKSQIDFVEKIDKGIVSNIDSYEKHRNEKYDEEAKIKKEIKGSSEIWFILINILFIFPWFLLLIMLLLL